MTNIAIDALQPTGYNLFSDAESFLNELALEEIPSIAGGGYRGKRYGNSHSFSGGGFSGYGGGSHSFSGGGSSGYGGGSHSFSGGGFSGHGGYSSKSYY